MAQPYDLSLEQLRAYKPELTREPDFDAFWQRSLDALRAVPLEYRLFEHDYPVDGVKVVRVEYMSFNDAVIEAWLAYPERDEPLPGVATFHGYNWAFDGNVNETVNFALKGYAVLMMMARGQQGKSVDNVVPEHGSNAGWLTKGILDPETYYYRAVYMDAVRALEVLADLPFVNEAKIGVSGGSQGGGLTIAAAALSPIPVVAIADFPFLAHFRRAIDISPGGPYLEINEFFRRNPDPRIEEQAMRTLSYFDVMNLAPNVRCRTWMSSGLVDTITPPSTVFAVYNHIQADKQIEAFRYYGHEYLPSAEPMKLRLLRDMLQR